MNSVVYVTFLSKQYYVGNSSENCSVCNSVMLVTLASSVTLVTTTNRGFLGEYNSDEYYVYDLVRNRRK